MFFVLYIIGRSLAPATFLRYQGYLVDIAGSVAIVAAYLLLPATAMTTFLGSGFHQETRGWRMVTWASSKRVLTQYR